MTRTILSSARQGAYVAIALYVGVAVAAIVAMQLSVLP